MTDKRTLKRIINEQRTEIDRLKQQGTAYESWLITAKAHGETEVIEAVYSICLNKFLNTFIQSFCVEESRKEKQ